MKATLRGVELELFEHEAVCDAIRASYDFYEAAILDDLLVRRPSEGVIVDVGAHIGNHAAYWLAFAQPLMLYAFEPQPVCYELLRRNLAAYWQAVLLPLALSDAPGWVKLEVDEVNRGRTRISPDGDVPALAVRLDDLGIDGITLLKVDVEGWQAHVLRGARATLSRWHPALLVEDEEDVVGQTLCDLYLCGYRHVAEWPGANHLWEWAA